APNGGAPSAPAAQKRAPTAKAGRPAQAAAKQFLPLRSRNSPRADLPPRGSTTLPAGQTSPKAPFIFISATSRACFRSFFAPPSALWSTPLPLLRRAIFPRVLSAS